MNMSLLKAQLRPLGWFPNELREEFVEFTAPCIPSLFASATRHSDSHAKLLGRAVFRGCRLGLIGINGLIELHNPFDRRCYEQDSPLARLSLPEETKQLAPHNVPFLIPSTGHKLRDSRETIDLEGYLINECKQLYRMLLPEARNLQLRDTAALRLVGQLMLLLARGHANRDTWERDIREIGISLNSALFEKPWIPEEENQRIECSNFINNVRKFAAGEGMPVSIPLEWLGPRVVGRVFEDVAGHAHNISRDLRIFGPEPARKAGRRQKGIFYTPPAIADWLAERVANILGGRGNVHIVDPAMGSGSLLWACAEAISRKQRGNWDNVKLFLDSCEGIDIDELAVMSAQIVASLHCKERDVLPEFNNLHVGNGLSWLEKEKPDCIIMNPPFSTYERMPEEYRDLAKKGKKDMAELFADAALEALSDDGVFAAVMPRHVLKGYSYRGLRERLNHKFSDWYVADFGASQLFPEASVYVCAVVGHNPLRPKVRYFMSQGSMPTVTSRLALDLKAEVEDRLTSGHWQKDWMVLLPSTVSGIIDKVAKWPRLREFRKKGVYITEGLKWYQGGKKAVLTLKQAYDLGIDDCTRPLIDNDFLKGPIAQPADKVIVWPYDEDGNLHSENKIDMLCRKLDLPHQQIILERPRAYFKKGKHFDIALKKVGRYLGGAFLPPSTKPWVTYRCYALACKEVIDPCNLIAYLTSLTAQLWARTHGKMIGGGYCEWLVSIIWDLPIAPSVLNESRSALHVLTREALEKVPDNLWLLAEPWSHSPLRELLPEIDGLDNNERQATVRWLARN